MKYYISLLAMMFHICSFAAFVTPRDRVTPDVNVKDFIQNSQKLPNYYEIRMPEGMKVFVYDVINITRLLGANLWHYRHM